MRADIIFKFVTPCIMGGADQAKAEMRVPSIRGQLKWWYKALGFDEDDIPNVFGGIDNSKASCSAFIIRDHSDPLRSSLMGCEDLAKKYDYFLWPLSGERKRGVIEEDQEVEIKVTSKKVTGKTAVPEEVLKAFLLLGSLGTRSRRCYGSIYPSSVVIDDVEWLIPQTIKEFESELTAVLDSYANCYVRTITDIACLDYKTAIRKCADFLKAFRCGSARSGKPSEWGQNDHDVRYQDVETLHRPALGLPLNQRYSDRTNVSTTVSGVDRLASPVHFKVIKLNDGFWPISITFPAHADAVVGKLAQLSGGTRKKVKISDDLIWEMMFPDSDVWSEGHCIGDYRQ